MKKGFRPLFFLAEGGFRPFWKRAAALIAYAAAFYGMLYGCAALFAALFNAWGLTHSNLSYAPAWARWIVAGHTDFSYALAYAASGAVGLLLSRRWRKTERRRKRLWLGAAMGIGFGAIMTVLALALDSMRLEQPLSEPRFAFSQLVMVLVILLGKLSAEILTKRILFDSIQKRLWGFACVGILSILLQGNWTNPLAVFNAVLLGVIGCILYERGGLVSSVGLQAGWTIFCSFLFGWPGLTSSVPSVYGLYHVSDAWLTGGNAGPASGFAATLVLVVVAFVFLRADLSSIFHRRRKKNG